MDRFVSHLHSLRQRLRRRGRTREEAEDLAQAAILRVLEYCQRGGEVQAPEAVVARAAMNLSINEHRRSRRHLFVAEAVEDLPLVGQNPLPEDIIAADECLARMQAALSSVSERTREVFLLHRVAGWSYSEIARRLGITESAVEKQIAKASLILLDAARGKQE
ncbi:RNA polymerase sigma factor [Peristeroidobacter soli]|uniref:RNA polymerase sigma factor n=1 Tax=Peristeroidobacter soli TaxID=2497877 RepID=UPI0013008422|nr:sigma-70 family RNA polymerase sigma factor [Peristeroidobacter soli]